MSDIDDAVRAWAKGLYSTEAGAELLIRHGKTIHEGAPWIVEQDKLSNDRPRMATIDVDALLEHSGAWSGGEQRIVRIAASLLGGPPVDLSEEIPGIDRANLVLVLAAIAHASGSHEHSAMRFDSDDNPIGFDRLDSAYAWPDVSANAT